VSIIILSYNRYASTTKACVDSLLRDPDASGMDILVVDNGSDSETCVALRELEKNSVVKVVYNNENIGFSAGNNIGLRQARADSFVLLNSDTIVPPKAITTLRRYLVDNPGWGAVGPVSNAVGNEQLIWGDKRNKEEVMFAGKEWVCHAKGSTTPTSQLSFFCVGFLRNVWEQVGDLDEGFGKGYYEDADYCLRITQTGKPLMIAEDVFIYHQGSASFGRQPVETRELMRSNKKRLLARYGRSVELLHLREANLRSLKYYLREKERLSGAQLDSLRYRFENRLKLGWEQMPRGWFKRWSYRRRLEAVEKAWTVT